MSIAPPRSRDDDLVLVPRRSLRMSRMRKAIVGIAAVGAVGVLAANGTFASFSASTANPNNVFSTGKLQLSNTVASGTACLSGYTGTGTGSAQSNLDTNDNGSCDALYNLSLRRPGDTTTANLTVANSGDYNGLLKFWLPNGCVSATVTTPAGSQNLCGKLEVFVQETTTLGGTATSSCLFPYDANAACSATWGAASDSLTNLASAATSSAPAPTAGIAISSGASKFVKVGIRFANGGFDGSGNGADNGYQNRSATFDLVWRLQEA